MLGSSLGPEINGARKATRANLVSIFDIFAFLKLKCKVRDQG